MLLFSLFFKENILVSTRLCRFILTCIKRERNPFLFNTLTLALLSSPFCLFIISTFQLVDLPFRMLFFSLIFYPFTHEFSLFLLFSLRWSLKGIWIQFVVHLSKEGSREKGLRTIRMYPRCMHTLQSTCPFGIRISILFFSLNSFLFTFLCN